jgi:hypothetical protein
MKRESKLLELASPAALAVAAFVGTVCSIFVELALGDHLRHASLEGIALFVIRFMLPVLLAGVLAYVVSRELYSRLVRSGALSSMRTHLWHASLCYAALLWLALENRHCSVSSPCYPDLIIAGVELALSALAVAAADALARVRTSGCVTRVA